MKTILLILSLFSLAIASHAQHTRMAYISTFQELAIEEMGRSGIPASIKIAQACLESRNGNSELSQKSNNHFGIKCKRNWKGKKVYYDDDHKNECFRRYRSVKDSYIDHTNFLMSNQRYAFLFKLSPNDYKGWAKGLKKAGYATARNYDKRLIQIIEENKLYRLDSKKKIRPMLAYQRKQALNQGMTVKKINDIKAVVARKGDTYEIIAQELNMKAWEIYKFNDRAEGYKPQPREVVYIGRKKRRAPKNHLTHKVKKEENMHYISQLYGIRLKPLYRRNRMDFEQKLNPGDLIYLRKRKPAN